VPEKRREGGAERGRVILCEKKEGGVEIGRRIKGGRGGLDKKMSSHQNGGKIYGRGGSLKSTPLKKSSSAPPKPAYAKD